MQFGEGSNETLFLMKGLLAITVEFFLLEEEKSLLMDLPLRFCCGHSTVQGKVVSVFSMCEMKKNCCEMELG